ncbi:MAG: hypothetical protein LBT89_05065, partial [Planctomycetaceae bacterium]|nr:hypothetical protein [Planctomycetaceae bacterium]
PNFVNSQNFSRFRKCFKAKFKDGFIIRADTFDNVYGKFPIGFTIWDLNGKSFPKSIELDIAEGGGTKKFWAGTRHSINGWIKEFDDSKNTAVGFMANPAPDLINKNQPYITVTEGTRHFNYFAFNVKNLIEGSIYFAVRLCIEHTYLNDRDQFLYPNDGWKTDIDFQNDCLLYTLFHGQNRILSAHGVNHWIPFTETEVNAREKFDSRFMSGFLKGKKLSKEAEAVLGAGRELWRYYHAKTKSDKTVSVNASYYDIREYFQGRSERGTMKTKSADEAYNVLIKALRDTVKVLAKKIEPKVYEYGFLNE